MDVCDRDQACRDALYCNGVERCMPGAPGADARGCVAGTPPCSAEEVCVEGEQRCQADDCADGGDADGDGDRRLGCGGTDCDDDDFRVSGLAQEVCDDEGLDEDCNPETIHNTGVNDGFGDGDLDRDGYVARRCFNRRPDGSENRGTDCDDTRASISPGVLEVCGNLVDDDCDDQVDENMLDGFADGDGDGWGDDARPLRVCPGATGFAEMGGDCNDADRAIHPSATETCNHRDDNCDGRLDESASRSTCSNEFTVHRSYCYARCIGQCERTSRPGYWRLGGTSTTPDSLPGAVYFDGHFDVGGSTTVTATWDVRYLSTPTGTRNTGAISVLLSPRVALGPDTVSFGVTYPGGTPTLMSGEFGVMASAFPGTGTAYLLVWEAGTNRMVRAASASLPASCLPTTTSDRTYRLTLTTFGAELTASLEAVGCVGGVSTVTATYSGFWANVYGERVDYPQYVVGAIADSDGTGMRADLERIGYTRERVEERGHCEFCPFYSVCGVAP